MAQNQAFSWDQGADLKVQLIYKEGADVGSAVAIDLSANYSVRMDIVSAATGTRVYTFNSADITDVDPILVGSQPDTTKEAVLSSGAGGTPNISITVPRALTLPTGAVYAEVVAGHSVFNYDIFLRNTSTDTQAKILQGQVTIVPSYTLWV